MSHYAGPPTLGASLRSRPAVLAAAGLVLVLVGVVMWWVTRSDDPAVTSGGCERETTVRVTVAPEVADLAAGLLRDPRELPDGSCVRAEVTAQRPVQTVGDLAALDETARAQVWVPDSSSWTGRVADVPLDPSGSLAVSPVVLGTSAAAVDELGWADEPPSWSEALTSGRPLAVPDLATSAEGLAALAAVRASLGGGEEADTALVRAALAASRDPAVDGEDALARLAADDADAPLVPVREQAVAAANRDAGSPALAAVYPSEGSPVLDYPVVRVGEPDDAAVDAVVEVLTSEAAGAAAQQAGFRAADGSAFEGAGDATGTREEAPEQLDLDPAATEELTDRLTSLASPTRLLAVLDVSTSMEAQVGDGTRATLARDAAKSALGLFPPDTAIGLWFFAKELDGDRDWDAVVPTRTLDTFVDGTSQAELLVEQLDALPSRLSPGGTGLYDTTLAAVRAAREDYDADAVNSVLLLTDGQEDDDEGLALGELLAALRAEEDPQRPVRVIGVALGPDADLEAVERIAEATGGSAYSAVEEGDLQNVLFDALRRRD
jgi:ABC-type Fe3+ transport system substrate-binding protein